MINVPEGAIIGKFSDGSVRRIFQTQRGYRDDETGQLLPEPPVRWSYMIEELDT
jgi:hypothetical protein